MAITWFALRAQPYGHLYTALYGPHITSCVSSRVCMPGGLLRKPPLKCVRRYPRGSHNRRLCSLTWIRTGALDLRSSAGICAWAFGPQTPTRVHELHAHVRPALNSGLHWPIYRQIGHTYGVVGPMWAAQRAMCPMCHVYAVASHCFQCISLRNVLDLTVEKPKKCEKSVIFLKKSQFFSIFSNFS